MCKEKAGKLVNNNALLHPENTRNCGGQDETSGVKVIISLFHLGMMLHLSADNAALLVMVGQLHVIPDFL